MCLAEYVQEKEVSSKFKKLHVSLLRPILTNAYADTLICLQYAPFFLALVVWRKKTIDFFVKKILLRKLIFMNDEILCGVDLLSIKQSDRWRKLRNKSKVKLTSNWNTSFLDIPILPSEIVQCENQIEVFQVIFKIVNDHRILEQLLDLLKTQKQPEDLVLCVWHD